MIDPSKFESPIKRGDAPMTPAQFARRMRASLDRILPATQREQLMTTNPDAAAQVGQALAAVQAEAGANNTFNTQLVAFRGAVTRLTRYRLADGRAEAFEDVPTGEVDADTGDPVVEGVLTQPAIDPLDATVSQAVFDLETGEQTGTQDVPNPLIVQDDTERAEAQAIIDATPDEVSQFDGQA